MAETFEIRGGWLIDRQRTATSALNLIRGETLFFDGELHADLWGAGRLLENLGGLSKEIDAFRIALSEPTQEATLQSVLRQEGWGRLFLELTGRCNERCVHCYASSSPDVDTALTATEVEQVITSASELGFEHLQLTGGDPLISEHLPMAVRLASGLNFRTIEVYTNGLALREPLVELFSEHSVRMAFSVYSHLPTVHDRVTQTPGSHERTCRAIRLALSSGIQLRVAGVEGCDRDQDETALRDFLVALGVPPARIRAARQRPVGRGKWAEDVSLLGPSDGSHSGESRTSRGKLSVSYSGDVVPCIFDRRTALGNIRKGSLKQILEQPLRSNRATPKLLPTLGEPLACSDCRSRRDLLERFTWEQR